MTPSTVTLREPAVKSGRCCDIIERTMKTPLTNETAERHEKSNNSHEDEYEQLEGSKRRRLSLSLDRWAHQRVE
jgi:hypothetical protein